MGPDMNKTIFLATSACLLLMLGSAYGETDLNRILRKHKLIRSDHHYWEVLNLLQEGAALSRHEVRLLWIDRVSQRIDGSQERIKPKEYLRYKAVGTLLEKNGRIFANLASLAKIYRQLVRDMEDIHTKATNVYNKRIPSRRVRERKYRILIQVKTAYETLRSQSLRVYEQGVRVESVLGKLYDPVVEAYSMSMLGEEVGKNFADGYNLSTITIDEIGIEQALSDTDAEMEKILQESKNVLKSALKNLDFNAN